MTCHYWPIILSFRRIRDSITACRHVNQSQLVIWFVRNNKNTNISVKAWKQLDSIYLPELVLRCTHTVTCIYAHIYYKHMSKYVYIYTYVYLCVVCLFRCLHSYSHYHDFTFHRIYCVLYLAFILFSFFLPSIVSSFLFFPSFSSILWLGLKIWAITPSSYLFICLQIFYFLNHTFHANCINSNQKKASLILSLCALNSHLWGFAAASGSS